MIEKELDRIMKSTINKNSCLEFHKSHLSICYPDANRIDSSNFNPIKAWNFGI